MKKGMRKTIKTIVAVLLWAAAAVSLFGCGGKGEEEGKTQTREEFCYVPEYQELDMDIRYASQILGGDDELFFVGYYWDEEAMESSNRIYRYDLLTDEYSMLPLPLSEDIYIQQAALDGEGSLWLAADVYEEGETGQSRMELWQVDTEEGSLAGKLDLTALFDEADSFYVNGMAADSQGRLYLSVGDSGIYVLDREGNKLGMIPLEDWLDSIFASGEGDVYIQYWGSQGMEMKQLRPDTLSMEETAGAESLISKSCYTAPGQGVLADDGSRVWAYDFESDTLEEIFDWLDADINSDDVSSLGAVSDGRFYAVLGEYTAEGTKYELVRLTKTEASQVPEKEEIVFGTTYLNQSMRKSIVAFNKSSDAYHITVKEYVSDYDYEDGLAQFNNDLVTGSGPDLIDISNLDMSLYVSKGVLEDLYPYMERDGIDRADYLENVLGAYETEGGLYGLTPQFYISTVMAKASKAGETDGWTLSEMLDFAEGYDAETLFQYGTRSSVFYFCIYNNIDDFIDWETGECYFDTEDFIRVLEFAARFPESGVYSQEEGIAEMLRQDKILLMQASLSSVQEYQMYSGLFGEAIAFVGYPCSQRMGNLIQPTNGSVAINAGSAHKDGAWEFIKLLISEEYQDSLVSEYGSGWGFPVRKSSLEKLFAGDMTAEYYEGENGEQEEQPKTSWQYDDFCIDIYAATEEEIEAVRSLIASARRCAGSTNTELVNIVTEETEVFFQGQKSAEETADIIQNRIQIYVNEMR